MQGYPHHYLASATGGNEGHVVVSGEGLPDLDTQSPPQFGGPEGVWSPETMLSAAVANCFILSFRAIARASKFEWTSMKCNVDGVLDRPERSTYFTAFNIQADRIDHPSTGIRFYQIFQIQGCHVVRFSFKFKIITYTTTNIRQSQCHNIGLMMMVSRLL